MAQAKTDNVQFVGVSIADFLAHTEGEIKAGAFHDGTKMSPPVRDALQNFTHSLRGAKAAAAYYVFVWSRFIFIKIEF
jgi:hypothetical protein